MPGKDPCGRGRHAADSITGTIIGCGNAGVFLSRQAGHAGQHCRIRLRTAGAFLLLLFYRILGGKLFKGMQGEQDVILHVSKAKRGQRTVLREVA